MLCVLMIGHGAIGAHVAAALADAPGITVRWALCRPGREAAAAAVFGPGVEIATSVADVPGVPDLAVDCAGHGALREHGPVLLARGIDLITVSTGALADAKFAERLEAAARSGGAQLRLLAGAVGGIDALRAARTGGLSRVSYIGRKPPAGWRGTPAEKVVDLERLTEPVEHFRGTAREAALRFPQNANVAATVALAGLGLDETQAVLIADPTISRNRHEIEAEGAFGRFRFEIEGLALPNNPKSSALTAMAVVAEIMALAAPIRVG
jgi:aspartate dehydrogenase